MANMVGVQTVIVPLMKVESHPVRQALQRMGVDINDKDEVDLDALDQKKLAAELKKGDAAPEEKGDK